MRAAILHEFKQPLALEDVAVPTDYPGLNVVPPGDRLSTCSDQMAGAQGLGQGREFRIRRLLKGMASHDVVIIDTAAVPLTRIV